MSKTQKRLPVGSLYIFLVIVVKPSGANPSSEYKSIACALSDSTSSVISTARPLKWFSAQLIKCFAYPCWRYSFLTYSSSMIMISPPSSLHQYDVSKEYPAQFPSSDMMR